MIKAALEYVVGLKKPETVRHGGGVYADKPLYQMKKADFPTLKLNTLESIVRYVQKIGDERESTAKPQSLSSCTQSLSSYTLKVQPAWH